MGMLPREAIQNFNVDLLEQLPLDDEIFFGMVKKAGLFPLNHGDKIRALSTKAEKTAYFLQHVIEPGAKQYLPKLLVVMKGSKVDNIVKLAERIEAKIVQGTYMCIYLYSIIEIMYCRIVHMHTV